MFRVCRNKNITGGKNAHKIDTLLVKLMFRNLSGQI